MRSREKQRLHFLRMALDAQLILGLVGNVEVAWDLPLDQQKVRELFLCLTNNQIEGVVEAVPGYRSLLIIYDPLKITSSILQERLSKLHTTIDQSEIPKPRTLEIPVVYGGECGPDLNWVAEYHKLSPEEVVRFHTGTTYQVYMIGFTPGFAYMGQLPEAIITPRRETPRTAAPRGSVGLLKARQVFIRWKARAGGK